MMEQESSRWGQFIRVLQHVFHKGGLPIQMTQQTLVMIPKGPLGVYCSLGLVGTAQNACSRIINNQIQVVKKYHDYVHGFQDECGTNMAILEV